MTFINRAEQIDIERIFQSCLHFVSDVDLKASPAMVSASSSSAEESSSDSRKQHFLVEGGMLMRLFRFCPDCGRRLERAQLTAVGTAAVVRLSCRCSSGSIITKRWESQQRIDPHKNHAHFTGNVAASIASVTAGLRYAVSFGLRSRGDISSCARFRIYSDGLNR